MDKNFGYVICKPKDDNWENKTGIRQYAGATDQQACLSYHNIFDLISFCMENEITHFWVETLISNNPRDLGKGHLEEFDTTKRKEWPDLILAILLKE